MQRGTRIVLTAILSIASALVVGPPASAAATIVVDETEDENNSDADCSLREAIQAANTDAAVDGCTAGSGTDTIQVPGGRFPLHMGQLTISTPMVIDGAGTLVERDLVENNPQRIFAVEAAVVTMSDLTIAEGDGNVLGAGILHGDGDLLLRRVVLRDNWGSEGGGIWSDADLTLEDSVVRNNVSGGHGGGVYSTGTLTIERTTVAGNEAQFGGGAWISAATALIDRSTFSGNTVTASGGAMWIAQTSTAFVLQNSTVSNNVAYNPNACCLSRGGGINNTGAATLVNVTITGNRSKSGGSGVFSDGYANTSLTVRNSILSDNPRYDDPNLPQDNCSVVGAFESEGFNLENGSTCSFTDPDDLPAANPKLTSLKMYGGRTKTHALKPTSPALDAGEPETAPTNGCRPTDQRGMNRPLDGPDGNKEARCDVGAFEMRLTPHAREISLNLRKHLIAKGRITLPDFYSPCRKNVRVLVQRKKDGDWDTVADDKSSLGGFYSAQVPDKDGVYRSQIKTNKLFRGDLHICKKATSDTDKHKD